MPPGKKDFQIVAPSDIVAEGATIQFLILRQLDRTNYLLTVARMGKSTWNEIIPLFLSAYNSLASVESMMWFKLIENNGYRVKAKKIKIGLNEQFRNNRITSESYFPVNLVDEQRYRNLLYSWYRLLVGQMGSVRLLPLDKSSYRFEKVDWNDTENAPGNKV